MKFRTEHSVLLRTELPQTEVNGSTLSGPATEKARLPNYPEVQNDQVRFHESVYVELG